MPLDPASYVGLAEEYKNKKAKLMFANTGSAGKQYVSCPVDDTN